jgi:hypothetical protein
MTAAPAPAAGPAGGDAALAEAARANPMALVHALRGADAAAATATEAALIDLLKSDEDAPANPDVVPALLEGCAVAALLSLLQPGAANAAVVKTAAGILHSLTYVSTGAATAVHAEGGLPVLLAVAEHGSTLAAGHAAGVLQNCLLQEAAAAACGSDPDFVRRFVTLLQNQSATADVLESLYRGLDQMCTHSTAARTTFWSANGISLAVDVVHRALQRSQPAVCVAALELLYTFRPHGLATQEMVIGLRDAGAYTACVELLAAATGRSCTWTLAEALQVAEWAACLLKDAYREPELSAHIRQLFISMPGAFAGFAMAVFGVTEVPAEFSIPLGGLEQLRKDAVMVSSPELLLLDPHFAACVILRGGDAEDEDALAKLARAFVADWSTPQCLLALAHPLLHQQLPAAASLAMLAGEDARFRQLLAGSGRLETLTAALVDVAMPGAEQTPQSCGQEYHRRVLHQAVKSAAAAAGLTAVAAAAAVAEDAAGGAGPPAKRVRYIVSALTADDVNVQRRDSTVLRIGERPFYALGAILEKKSIVLAQALQEASLLDPVPLPLPAGVPAELHYELFHAAVEHCYTGTVRAVADAALLPLWCLSDHLQMDDLRAWCIEQLAPLLRRDMALLESAWTAALARPCDALCDACAAAWLGANAPDAPEPEDDGASDDASDEAAEHNQALLQLLARLHAACPADAPLSAQLARVLRAGLLNADASAAAAGA